MTTDGSRHVLLSGPMGVGKTTVGRRVAERLERRFVDLDEVVETARGQTVAEIFAEEGEPAFRALERDALQRVLASSEPLIVALGGGTLVDDRSRRDALDRGLVVTLTAPIDVLAARLGPASGRPLLAGSTVRESLAGVLASRREVYLAAHALVPAVGAVEEVVDRIHRALGDAFIEVAVEGSPYAVRITDDAWPALVDTVMALHPSRVFLAFDRHVAELFGDRVREVFERRGIPIAGEVSFPPGEEHKSLIEVERALQVLADGQADRASLLVAIGGGVTTDMAGLAAALYARGIRWITVPTTLLSMVDASVGGKTGVDFAGAKNLVGAFHQPSAVIVSPPLSSSETERGVRSGLAELVKTLALGDVEAFTVLEAAAGSRSGRFFLAREDLSKAVGASIRVKASIVAHDPVERGARASLNFGHTLGHALEAWGGFTRWTHGEAVALGMVLACRLGNSLGITPVGVTERIRRLLSALGLGVEVSGGEVRAALPLTLKDKKRQADSVRFVLLRDLGRVALVELSFDEVARWAEDL